MPHRQLDSAGAGLLGPTPPLILLLYHLFCDANIKIRIFFRGPPPRPRNKGGGGKEGRTEGCSCEGVGRTARSNLFPKLKIGAASALFLAPKSGSIFAQGFWEGTIIVDVTILTHVSNKKGRGDGTRI